MFKNFLNGLAFGITQIVPGVSGGTIAIMLGFYDELISAINNFTKDLKKQMKFLIPLGIGIVVGIFVLSSVINYLLTNFSFPTMSFFIGLIVGLIPLIYLKVKDEQRLFNFKEILFIIIPILIVGLSSHLNFISAVNPEEVVVTFPLILFLFFAGFLAAAALIIPGVSGSFILLLLGLYPLATYFISQISLLLTDITNTTLMLEIIKVLGPLGIGIIIGVLLTARIVEKLLKNYLKPTYLIILGLLIGSTYALIRDPIVYQSGINLSVLISGGISLIIGCLLSFCLGKKKI